MVFSLNSSRHGLYFFVSFPPSTALGVSSPLSPSRLLYKLVPSFSNLAELCYSSWRGVLHELPSSLLFPVGRQLTVVTALWVCAVLLLCVFTPRLDHCSSPCCCLLWFPCTPTFLALVLSCGVSFLWWVYFLWMCQLRARTNKYYWI